MKKKYIFVLLLLISITVVSSVSTFFYVKLNNDQNAGGDDILVMTSCNPVYIATLNVLDGVPGYKVENLSQPTTGCLHDYTLTTEDMKNLSKADVLVVNGGGMEGYLEDVEAAYPELKIIDTYEILEHEYDILPEEEEEEEQTDEVEDHDHEHHHDHGANSHIWMSPAIHQAQTQAIVNALIDLQPEHKAELEANGKKYIDAIGYDIGKIGFANDHINVAILHEAFAYTAMDLGFNVVATMDLDEERQVSAGEVSDFINEIKEHDVKLVLAEYDYGNAMGKLIEEQTDAKVVYLETLVHGSYDKDSYVTVMNNNYKLIKESL